MTNRMPCETACLADIGAREEQQDRVEVFADEMALLIVLADGMGGHEGGAMAAQVVIDVAREQFDAFIDGKTPLQLTDIVYCAHERIKITGAELGLSPHSTCVLLHLTDTTATWAHVGDSRLYHFDNGRLTERTIDHSMVELMRLQGRLSEEEMKVHPDQNRLFEALGGNNLPEVETGYADNSENDGFLLASDGLWENVSDSELEAVFKAQNLDEALRGLVESAKTKGEPECDNISVAVARHRRATPSLGLRISRAFTRFREVWV
ncbi:MAG: protein phosphatase 2C domain-containing protein [Gammaproteobacteria bacterium]|nr:protein phosphatase 2C domain-containing protein [Gammaproteobacteria bacterium]